MNVQREDINNKQLMLHSF